MAKLERSIKIAIDKSTGEILNADDLFDSKKDGFAIRRQFHEKELLWTCCECGQDLNVSGSKYDRLHFKHQPSHDFCILTDGELSPKDHQCFTEILKAKESDRHKELKNRIGQLLTTVDGIDISSISIDNKFIIRNGEKKRPDVYCKYFDKELVFEIQLSELSQKYILSRYNFYKKNGMYLIWILDNFDIHNQGTLERDIKYLTKFENFFKLDEIDSDFKLECEYKFPFITNENRLLTKWLKKSVPLSQLYFDNNEYQIYYYNYGDNKLKIEAERLKRIAEIQAAEQKMFEEKRHTDANGKATKIIELIRECKESSRRSYGRIFTEIGSLNELSINLLNTKLNLHSKIRDNKPILHYWFHSAKDNDDCFIEFLLDCKQIEMNVNMVDANGKTLFQELFENKNLPKNQIVKSLFKRGYRLTETDKVCYQHQPDFDENSLLRYCLCDSLSNRMLVEDVFVHDNLLFMIESARRKEIVGYKLPNWIAFANNAIHHHKEYWEYIEVSFKKFGIWDVIINSDKKKSFEKKINDFYRTMPAQKYDFDEVFKGLYSDLVY